MANETWHAQQKCTFEKDGSYVLEVPNHDDWELVMAVLRHGADVEAIGRGELRATAKRQIALMAAKY